MLGSRPEDEHARSARIECEECERLVVGVVTVAGRQICLTCWRKTTKETNHAEPEPASGSTGK